MFFDITRNMDEFNLKDFVYQLWGIHRQLFYIPQSLIVSKIIVLIIKVLDERLEDFLI